MRSNDGQISRRVKTLLISIDGKTDSSIYISSLSSFGNVSELLASLENDRLIEAVDSEDNVSSTLGPAVLAWSDAAFQASIQPLQEDKPTWRQNSLLASRPSATPASPAANPFSAVNAATTDLSGQAQARTAVSLMSDFVSCHFPEQAMELILALEKLGAREDLLANLRDYEAFIAPAGASAALHLAQVRALLASR